jgi:hypothetical protein
LLAVAKRGVKDAYYVAHGGLPTLVTQRWGF